jgi:hypothetical protein
MPILMGLTELSCFTSLNYGLIECFSDIPDAKTVFFFQPDSWIKILLDEFGRYNSELAIYDGRLMIG